MTRNRSTLTKASSLALAAALATQAAPAAAQSLLGTPTVASGSANIVEGPGTTDISFDASQTVIDWTPDDNAVGVPGQINFQNSGTVATFSSTGDFAVLNRVNVADASRIVSMNGTINSLVNGQAGGSVFFYSPSGFVIGSSAIINVGALVLSASPIAVDGNGQFITGTTVTFNQAPNPNAAINTLIGSQINANGVGNYVALVAPAIQHRGTIRTDTAAALVAAEAATIDFSPDGLFNIQVTVGTDAPNGVVVNSGVITRNDPTEGIGNHYAYLVSVAKNDAVSMLIQGGGSVGFDTATSAAVENNVVVLSGGFDVSNGFASSPSGTSTVALTINNAALSTDVRADVTGGAAINSAGGVTSFGGDLTISAGLNPLIDASNGNALTIAGNLTATTGSNGSAQGRIVRLGAQNGSTLTVGGDVTLQANSFGTFGQLDGEDGGDATGGNAQIIANTGSTINIAGSVTLLAEGYGGDVNSNATGGTGTGGQVFLLANDGNSQVNIGGSVYGSAQGFGGSTGECSVCVITGGAGFGGSAQVAANNGANNSLNLGSDVTLTAAGNGGAGDVQGGFGRGGLAVLAAGDGSTVTVLADTEVDATGFGGYGFDGVGGTGIGGTARIASNNNITSLMELTGPAFIIADGQGGDGATGGTGTGGLAVLAATLGTIHAHNDVVVSARSNGGTYFFGGDGGDGLADLDATDMTQAAVFAGGGTIIIDGLTTANASAQGGDGTGGGDGGNAQAGLASIFAQNNDTSTSTITIGDAVVLADGFGGAGGSGTAGTDAGPGGNGGNGGGGRSIITAAAGSGVVTINAAVLSASAEGGQGGDGGSGDGGLGGDGGDGGTAIGGFINVGTESGNVNFAQAANNGSATFDSIVALTNAVGGDGGSGTFGSVNGTPGNGGAAYGGLSTLLVRGAPVTVNGVALDASATGGNSGLDPNDIASANGGTAVAGATGVLATNRLNLPDQRGTLTAGSVVGTAIATGGSGAVAGGEWTQGASLFEIVNSDVTIGSVNISVSADGLDPNAAETFSNPIAVVNGSATILGAFQFTTPGLVSVYADNGTLSATTISVSGDNYIHADARPAPTTVGTFSAGSMGFQTNADLIIDAHLVSGGGIGLGAPGLVDVENLTSSAGSVSITAGTSITAGDLDAAGGIGLDAGTSITAGDAIAGAGFDAGAQNGSITIGDVTASDFLVMNANGGITAGNLDGGLNFVLANATAGSVSTGNVTGDFIELHASGGVTAGDLTAVSGSVIVLAEGGAIDVGEVDAATFLRLLSFAGVAAGDLTSGAEIEIEADGDVLFGDVHAGTDFDFDTSGSVTGGDIVAGNRAGGSAGGAVIIGDISAGLAGPSGDGFSIGISSGTSIDVGDLAGVEGVGFATFGDLTSGDITAGEGFMALVGGDIDLGAIATSAQGTVYLADSQMFVDAGGLVDEFDPLAVLALDPLPTGGSITINGPVSTGEFRAAAGTSLTTGAITAQSIEASAGGLASINGMWSAPFVQLLSDDIDIGANGGIEAGATGSVILASTNATQALIGDGLTGTGYRLTNAEFARISSGSLTIVARGDATAAADMLIGDLDITGPQAGSTIDDPNGSVFFATGDLATETPGGVIRIDGDVHATGFTANNALDFTTGRFELNADTGSLVLESAPGTLGGIIDITAERIHVASADVLQKLAIDSHYNGYVNDLATPIASARPGGVMNAATINVSPTEAVLVQNTGTAGLRAGFKAGFVELFPPAGAAPGSIELIVNGQLVTPAGTRTGVLVRDDLVVDTDLSVYATGSTINGCLLVGACVVVEPPSLPPFLTPGFTPTPGIQDEITLIDDNVLPPPLFGNEDFIDDNDEATEDGATSPIEPPQPLFDTSALDDKGEIDDPVSGGGNPALMDSPPPPPTGKEDQQ